MGEQVPVKKAIRFLLFFCCLILVEPILSSPQERSLLEEVGAKLSLLEEKVDALITTQKTLLAEQTEIETELTSLGTFIRRKR